MTEPVHYHEGKFPPADLDWQKLIPAQEPGKRQGDQWPAEHDEQILAVFEVIKKLIEEDEKPQKKISYIKERQTKYGKKSRKN